jgi:uncharacterized membrane protein YccF (DUF307 family)
MRFLLNII